MHRKPFDFRQWLPWLQCLVAVAVVIGLLAAIYKAGQQLQTEPIDWTRLEWSRWIAGVFVYSATLLLTGWFWRMALISLGGSASLGLALRAFVLSQLGKYVPGKAMVVVIRAGLVHSETSRLGPAVASTFLETLMWIFVGAQIAAGYFLISGIGGTWLRVVAFSIMCMSGLITLPPNFSRLVRVAAMLKGRRAEDGASLPVMTWRMFGVGILVLGLGWLLAGASGWLVIGALPDLNLGWSDYWLILAAVSLGTVAGFVSLIPGGLGVRELIVIPVLATRFSTPVAVAGALALRLVWIAAELVLSATMEFLHRTQKFR